MHINTQKVSILSMVWAGSPSTNLDVASNCSSGIALHKATFLWCRNCIPNKDWWLTCTCWMTLWPLTIWLTCSTRITCSPAIPWITGIINFAANNGAGVACLSVWQWPRSSTGSWQHVEKHGYSDACKTWTKLKPHWPYIHVVYKCNTSCKAWWIYVAWPTYGPLYSFKMAAMEYGLATSSYSYCRQHNGSEHISYKSKDVELYVLSNNSWTMQMVETCWEQRVIVHYTGTI